MFLDALCQVLLVAEVVEIFWSLNTPYIPGTVLGIEGASRAVKIMAGGYPLASRQMGLRVPLAIVRNEDTAG
jgi:hypothetical protein